MSIIDYISELLHLDNVSDTKLMDLWAGYGRNTFYLTQSGKDAAGSIAEGVMRTMLLRRGKPGNTALVGSSKRPDAEQNLVGGNKFDWYEEIEYNSAEKVKDPGRLNSFIDDAYKAINLKGNNPVYLTVGALEWKIATKYGAQTVLTPLLIFPVRLVRYDELSPVCIEFVDDDAHFNPCLYHRLRRDRGEALARSFPHPNGNEPDQDFDDALDLTKFMPKTGEFDFSYFDAVERFVSGRAAGSDGSTVFAFRKDVVALVAYNHDEMCMYFDIMRNIDLIENHPLVARLFKKGKAPALSAKRNDMRLVLAADSVQQDIISRVVSGESMVIKGPPGTGKTLTIANMIGALMDEGKNVLFASEKLSALSEVYAKLPAELRKFALLLEGETEAKAAKISRKEIVTDLRRVVDEKKKFRLSDTAVKEHGEAESSLEAAFNALNAYVNFMFEQKGNIGLGLYAILDASMKNSHLPYAELTASPASLLDVKAEEYYNMKLRVAEADVMFDRMTDDGRHVIEKCPWYGVGKDTQTETALRDYAVLAKEVSKLLAVADGKLAAYPGLSFDGVSLSALRWLFAGEYRAEEVEAAAEAVEKERRAPTGAVENVKNAQKKYVEAKAAVPAGFVFREGQDARSLADDLDIQLTADEFPVDTAMLVCGHERLFLGTRGTGLTSAEAEQLLTYVDCLDTNADRAGGLCMEIRKAFSEEAEKACGKLLAEAAEKLAPYKDTDAKKPGAFDFAARSLFKKLAAESYVKGISFADIVAAAAAYGELKALDTERIGIINHINQCFGKALDDDETKCLSVVLKYCREKGKDVRRIVEELMLSKDALTAAIAAFEKMPDGVTVGDVKAALRLETETDRLHAALAAMGRAYAFAGEVTRADAPRVAATVCALFEICSSPYFEYKSKDEAANVLLSFRAPEAEEIIVRIGRLATAFGRKHFRNHYTVLPLEKCTLGDWRFFVQESSSRNVLGAVQNFAALKETCPAPFDLRMFFADFEREKARPGSFEDIFEHSFFRTLGDAILRRYASSRNGLGSRITDSLEAFGEAEKKLARVNAKFVEDACMKRIVEDDPDFGFVHADRPREGDNTVRKLFKEQPCAIMKLMKCLILSPSSASLLLRPKEYNDFDIVIVDEASQLKPVTLLPLLFRAKQCVIVGDEHQMPHIEHFRTQNVAAAGEQESEYDPRISALSLALANEQFTVKELVCHYRSATESLIAFSQKMFYPNMRTFPATVPKAEGELGFEAIYVDGAVFADRRNEQEAAVVVECLRKHFAKHYDEKTGKLAESVGVVAFNDEQVKCIEERVARDKELGKKIARAKAVSGDVPEKTIFFRTVEKVQGLETSHLILSMTYGKAEGASSLNRFGDLNNDRYGVNVFNVAITRAQKFVTMVQSLHSYEITNPNIGFIKDYMQMVERFGEDDGEAQFVSAPVRDGFVRDVAAAVSERFGIPQDRVVTGYGVTEGSVRIPIAVLSEDKHSALFGIMCETDIGRRYNYVDYNVRYSDILSHRGWKLYRLNILDWFDRGVEMPQAMTEFIKQNIR